MFDVLHVFDCHKSAASDTGDCSGLQLLGDPMVVICALILIFLGCFMDGVSIMLIAAPLMVPVVGGLGYDLIQFGIVMTIGIQVGQLTPPVGINLFQVAGMQKESVASVIRGAVPFLLLLMAVWVLVIFCPGLTAVATTLFT